MLDPAVLETEGSATEADCLAPLYPLPRLELVSGHGAWVRDHAGREYLDFVSGIAVNALGHSPLGLARALSQQLRTLGQVSNLFGHPAGLKLARALTRATGYPKVFFANSGTEGVEASLKFARASMRARGLPGRDILAFRGGFHGRTALALSATWTPSYREPFEPLIPGVRFADFNRADQLERGAGRGRRGGDRRAGPGRGRCDPGRTRVPGRAAGAHTRTRLHADLRRSAERHGPLRPSAGRRALRRARRCGGDEQGAGRRHSDRRGADERRPRRPRSRPACTAAPSAAIRWPRPRRCSCSRTSRGRRSWRACAARGRELAEALARLCARHALAGRAPRARPAVRDRSCAPARASMPPR